MDHSRIHPLLVGLAVAVLILSAVTIAAVTGVLPTVTSKDASPAGSPDVAAPAGRSAAATAPGAGSAAPRVADRATACANCGVIESIRAVQVEGPASGMGAVAGGLAGAVLGNQFGHGSGRTALTIAGAAGGAFAGNSIEKNMKKHTVFRVTVRLGDGTVRTLSESQQPPFAVGDRVRIVNGNTIERA